jgi:hypothetical protein
VPTTMVTDNEKPFRCVARRHMRPAMFVTYDAMLAMCKSDKEGILPGEPLIFWASEKKLANMNNRSAEQESQALDALEKAGWIVARDEGQSRWRKGRWTTRQYRVLEHDEYVAAHGGCPPLRYDNKTGEKVEAGRLAPALVRKRIRKILGVERMPDFMTDQVAEVLAAAKKAKEKKK